MKSEIKKIEKSDKILFYTNKYDQLLSITQKNGRYIYIYSINISCNNYIVCPNL